MCKHLGKSKEVGTQRYLSLVVPLKKVGDEVVHKELGDRIERAATTSSSLEAEQDSGSVPRCQDTILGDVDAQTRFETTSKQFKDPPFLKVNTFGSGEDINAVRHQLVLPVQVPAAEVNPIIYTSCIQQFWATANVKMVNGVRQLQALIDKKKMIITESSIRSDLHLEDAEGNSSMETQDKGLMKDLMFDSGVLDGDEMFCGCYNVVRKKSRVHKLDDSTAGEAVTTAGVEDSALPTIPTTVEETLAQTLMEIKAAKPKAKGIVFHDLEKQVSKPTVSVTQPSIKDKGKGIMQEPERPLTKKDQVALDEDLARNIQAQLDAEIIEEERLERQKQEEANIALIESWENTQAMMEADRLLAERLQTREREELTDEEKGKLFMELMEKRRKHFAALRAQEKRNRPPTKAQKRSQMSTYLKHMGGYKHKQLMGKSYDEIQKLFDKEMKRVNTFVAMSSEAQESNEKKVEGSEEKAKSSRKKSLGKKRAVKEQQQESPKRQKLGDDKETDEHEEVEADDTAELKKHLVIKKDDDIAIDVIPLATKPPVIVDYKLLKEGIMVHYQLIRADGSSKRHSSMIRLLQGINREDLQTLWKLVKTKHGDLRPEDEYERVMWGDLKVMFEPDIRSDVWRNLQGYKVIIWKLIDSCGVHFVRFGNVYIFMLVEKRPPHTNYNHTYV
ncbi:hypothetical protein Tco_1030890 [Tanacetum coccineum]|uniref:Uncharacterized protein n=1 Tax=Tanacetum coccineum TaxID=301880 RepID=A0ABQ5G7M1_9ASTR